MAVDNPEMSGFKVKYCREMECEIIYTTPTLNYTVLWESRFAPRLRFSAVYRDPPRRLKELITAITAYIRNMSKKIYRKCSRIKFNGFRPV
jgi:hypothetical protein